MSEEFDLSLLNESFAEMLGSEWPRENSVAFAAAPRPLAEELWAKMADLGWTALTAPEDAGGLALGNDSAAALHFALGAAAAPVPALGTGLAIELLLHSEQSDRSQALLAGLADGSLRVAMAEPSSEPLPVEGKMVSGSVRGLLDAISANLYFLRARSGGSIGWIVVEADAPGVSADPIAITDTSRTLANVTLLDVSVTDAQFIPASGSTDDTILALASISIAADSIGGGETALAGTIEYMKVREQFGRVIGSFQALKHRVADHQAALIAARGLVEHAASLAPGDPGLLLAALTAKQHATRAVAEIARDCVQLHGGVGFTAEFFPHVFLKRAKLNEVLFGTRAVLLDRIADLLEAAL